MARYLVKGVPSSFVFNDMKLQNDKGSGEAKLFVGPKSKLNDIEDFFKFNEAYRVRFDKDNLLEYLHEIKIECVFQKLNQYKDASKEKWNELYSLINGMSYEDMIIRLQKFTDASLSLIHI